MDMTRSYMSFSEISDDSLSFDFFWVNICPDGFIRGENEIDGLAASIGPFTLEQCAIHCDYRNCLAFEFDSEYETCVLYDDLQEYSESYNMTSWIICMKDTRPSDFNSILKASQKQQRLFKGIICAKMYWCKLADFICIEN